MLPTKQGQTTTAPGLLNVLSAHRVRSHAPARRDCLVTLPPLPPRHSRQRLSELKQSAIERDFARLRTPDYADCMDASTSGSRRPPPARLMRPSSLATLGKRHRGSPSVSSSHSLPHLLRGDLASALEDIARELRKSEREGGRNPMQVQVSSAAAAAGR